MKSNIERMAETVIANPTEIARRGKIRVKCAPGSKAKNVWLSKREARKAEPKAPPAKPDSKKKIARKAKK